MASATGRIDNWEDILVLAVYFVVVLVIGLWSMRRSDRGNVKSYFLAGRSMPWVAVGASLFSSNIGSEHFVGLAGSGASSGIANIMFEWLPAILILALGWYFIPVYISSGVYTLPEYMERRLGGNKIRIYLSCLSLLLSIVIKLAVSMFAGSLFLQMATGWNMYVSVIILLAVTGFYTTLGGLTAVMYTDTFQTVVMTIGACVLMGVGMNEVGNIENLMKRYMNSSATIQIINSTCGLPRKDAFHVFLDPTGNNQPWPGLVIVASLGCVAYWCCDQIIVQRSLAAKNIEHAKGGSVMAASLKILPLFLMIFPGMISRVLFPDEVACADPDECMRICENPVGCSNIAYPKMVLELLPKGLRGFLMAVILSAIMSSLTSIFNSSSTLFTMDLWRRFRPRSTQRELLIVGRIVILFMCAISIIWLPLIKGSQGGQLFNYINMVQANLMAPVGPAFMMAILWKRTTELGIVGGLVISHVCGVIRLVLEFVYPAPPCGEPETRPAILYKVHFLYFGTFLVLLTPLTVAIISMLTPGKSEEELDGLTWWTRIKANVKLAEEDNDGNGNELCSNVEDDMPQKIKNRTPGIPENQFLNSNAGTDSLGEEVPSEIESKGMTPTGNVMLFLCGKTETGREIIVMTLSQKQKFMRERPKCRWMLNTSAFLVMGTILFLLGYFA
ncbi:sodium/glucose cotransporter 5-like [Mizuhopecten yessoensis]|uniref:Sodium/myo-inositol cotransporter 2 n=1 Tax=Mizuhopecten yessoensis TaxID=6573 RepID=A0A210Q1K5_MIZYE|nr:sodium/glucose cotransporter 5-like [Mizuhopecten yessoensis]OWF42602.1 Sodium/myo-inositol cotransporter 2 [Mizuhopecten yessoensis]